MVTELVLRFRLCLLLRSRSAAGPLGGTSPRGPVGGCGGGIDLDPLGLLAPRMEKLSADGPVGAFMGGETARVEVDASLS